MLTRAVSFNVRISSRGDLKKQDVHGLNPRERRRRKGRARTPSFLHRGNGLEAFSHSENKTDAGMAAPRFSYIESTSTSALSLKGSNVRLLICARSFSDTPLVTSELMGSISTLLKESVVPDPDFVHNMQNCIRPFRYDTDTSC